MLVITVSPRVWEVWMTPVRLTKIIRVEIFPLFCWLWWQFVVIWSETEAGDDSGQGEGQSQVMTTSHVTRHKLPCRMSMLHRLLARIRPSPGPINNWGTLLNASSTYLITFTSSEIILETPPDTSWVAENMALGNEEIIQNGKVFFAKICVKQIFLSFYGERFALTIFLNRPTFCIETNGNVGCNSSEKYPSICFWMGPLFSATSGS